MKYKILSLIDEIKKIKIKRRLGNKDLVIYEIDDKGIRELKKRIKEI